DLAAGPVRTHVDREEPGLVSDQRPAQRPARPDRDQLHQPAAAAAARARGGPGGGLRVHPGAHRGHDRYGRGGGAPARGARVLPSPAGLRRPAGQREVAAEEVARGAGAGRPVAPAPGARALSPAFPAPIRYFRRRLVLRGIDPAGQVSNRSTAGALVRGRVARLVVRASGRLVGRFLGLHLGPPLLLPRAPLLVVIAATPVAGDGEILARDLLVEAQERAQRLDGH